MSTYDKVGIMQPYLFPYLGYFQLIQATDKWVVFDDIQFSKKSWVNRNRILHPEESKEWQFFTLPLSKYSLGTNINELRINSKIKWKEQFFGKLTHYKNKAPFYNETIAFLQATLSFETESVSDFIAHCLNETCNYLSIPYSPIIFSSMSMSKNNIYDSGDWALQISKYLGASEYINPVAGEKIFNVNKFNDHKIKLTLLTSDLKNYSQKRKDFCSSLSIIDIMMWNNLADIKHMLSLYSLRQVK